MLNEIYCEQFNKKTIKFQNGLNIITGGEHSFNSIGKTTLLLIIDFCLGGNDFKRTTLYGEKKEIEVKFSLRLGKEDKYFIRKKTSKHIYTCDDKYNILGQISNKEYCAKLKDYYYKANIKTFRQLQYKFIRTQDVKKFDYKTLLISYSRADNNIEVIEDLFEKYGEIDAMLQEIKLNEKLTRAYKDLEKDKNNNLIVNKSEYKRLEKELFDVDDFLENFGNKIHIDSNSEKIGLLDQYLTLIKKENVLDDRLVYLNNLTVGDANVSQDFDGLLEYFPNINKSKFDEIAAFHMDIKRILKKEIDEEIDVVNKDLQGVKQKIKTILNKIGHNDKDKLLEYINDSKLVKSIIRKKDIEDKMKLYEGYENKLKRNKVLAQEIKEKQSKILTNIENIINDEMSSINKLVKNGATKLSMFVTNEKTCALSNNDDDGSGCSIQNMIYFDLAILKHSSLKFLIHDKEMFSNIDKAKWGDLLKVYRNIAKDKQIFIAIDDFGNIDENGKQIIRENTVITLSNETKLFS